MLATLFMSLSVSAVAEAATLEEAFVRFRSCDFQGFFYAEGDPKTPAHSYFIERNLRPYREQDGLYHIKTKDSLWGLPVSELIVPGTWDFHGVVFDAPLKEVRAHMKHRFGKSFSPSKDSNDGESPALSQFRGNPNQSILFCNEREGGF